MITMYEMKYAGVAGEGHGAICVGNGQLIGVDVTGATYAGTYAEPEGKIGGTCTLTSAGGALVTGQPIPPGTTVPIAFTLPADLGGGAPVRVFVASQPVEVSFKKVGEIT